MTYVEAERSKVQTGSMTKTLKSASNPKLAIPSKVLTRTPSSHPRLRKVELSIHIDSHKNNKHILMFKATDLLIFSLLQEILPSSEDEYRREQDSNVNEMKPNY